jgi:hypothetical protein
MADCHQGAHPNRRHAIAVPVPPAPPTGRCRAHAISSWATMVIIGARKATSGRRPLRQTSPFPSHRHCRGAVRGAQHTIPNAWKYSVTGVPINAVRATIFEAVGGYYRTLRRRMKRKPSASTAPKRISSPIPRHTAGESPCGRLTCKTSSRPPFCVCGFVRPEPRGFY